MPDPRYRQIAADLRRRIESGEWSDGERRLPPEPALEEEYGASRNTIREAVKWLTTRGLVSTQPGRGTFVNEKIRPFITTLSADQATGLGGGEGVAFTREAELQFMVPVTTEPEVGIQRAKGDTAQGLRVPEGESLVFRHQKRFIDTKPYSLQTSFYPMSLVQRGPWINARVRLRRGPFSAHDERLPRRPQPLRDQRRGCAGRGRQPLTSGRTDPNRLGPTCR
jgi:DNA-binding GntR family transcriptional regulator